MVAGAFVLGFDHARETEQQGFGTLHLIGKTLGGRRRAHARDQFVGIVRFADEIVGAACETGAEVGKIVRAGHHDERQKMTIEALSDRLTNFVAVHFRHHLTQHYDIEFLNLQQFQRIAARCHRAHAE